MWGAFVNKFQLKCRIIPRIKVKKAVLNRELVQPALHTTNADIDHCFNFDLISAHVVDTFS